MNKLNGQVAVLTGASSGIGEATAIALGEKGAKVVLAARREERLKEIAEKIKVLGGEAVFCQTDVTSRDDMQRLANVALEQFGTVDVWINNAGIMPLSFLDKLKVDEWERMVDVNIKGVLYGVAAVLPVMMKQKHGHVVNVASLAAHSVGLTTSVYSGTKFAVHAITEGLRQELSPRSNIRTTLISPGAVNTELRGTITDEHALTLLTRNEMKNRLEPKDIANAIVYALEQPEYVSVSEIVIRPTEQRV